MHQDPADFNVSLKVLLTNKKGEHLVLFARSTSTIWHGKYDFPGGRINNNEINVPFHKLIDREIKEEVPSCPACDNSDFKEEKSVEVGNIFKLGTKYSHPFNLKVSNENGEKKDVIMGCYGIGLSRLLGTVVEINNDKKGIIWPENISPFKVHLLFLEGGDKKAATLLYEKLKKSKIETLYDDRPGISAGEKFADADLLGIPFRVVISERTGEKAEIKSRTEPEVKLVSTNNLLEILKEK